MYLNNLLTNMWGKLSKEATIAIFIFLLCSTIFISQPSTSNSIPSIEGSDRGNYSYHNYTTLVEDLESLNTTYSSIFELTTAQSEFGLPDCKDGYKIWIVRITNEYLGFNKPEVLFIGGHHGDEDVSIETAYYFAEWLVTSYETDEHVRYLIDHREIYIMPVINPWGWENDIRENGNGEDPNRDYPYANTSYNQALSTISARAVHELMKRHLFISAITWHSGLQGIYYAWGTPVHDTPTDEAPDTVAFYEQARLMSAKGGNFGGKYTFGPANEEIYGVRGAWSDYAYAATWDTQYTAPEFLTNGSRSLAIGVEISNDYAPPESSLGNSNGVYDPGGTNDGWIPKNIRMALVLADTAEPYIDWKDREEIPSIAYPGQNITLEWEVMGAFKADETQLNYEFGWNNGAPSTIDQYQTTSQSGWSGWYGNTFSEQVTMPQEPGDYYFVVSAVVDQSSLEQTIPEPDVEPQSLYVNQRTNESWDVGNNGNIMNGQVVWYSEVVHIEVQESGFIYITDHPQVAETKTSIQLNWTVGVGSNYVINQTQILWGNSSDPMNNSKFTESGLLVEEQIVDPNIICSYLANITMPPDPGQYYFIAKVRLDDIQTQAVQLELWSQVVEIEVELPPDGYGLEVSTPIVEYFGNMTQKIDILGVKVSCPDLELDNCDVNMLNTYQYTIYSIGNIIIKKGDLSWTGSDWQALDINVSSLPENYYYVTCYFEHDLGNGSNDHASGDSSEFYLNHIIIVVTPPVLEVTDGKMRILNITNVTIIYSYPFPPEVNITNITLFKYMIENYTNHWKPIMLGELNWTGDQWQALNINLSKYGTGEYRVNFYFYSSNHYEDYTMEFNFTYIEGIKDPGNDETDSEPEDISVCYVIIPIVIIIFIMFFVYFFHKDRKK